MLGDGERSGNDCVLTVCLYLMSSLPNFEAEMGVLTFGRIQSEASAVPVTCPMSHEYPVAEMRSDANLSGLEPPAFCSVSLHSLPKASGGSASVNSVPVTILPLAEGEINTRSVQDPILGKRHGTSPLLT